MKRLSVVVIALSVLSRVALASPAELPSKLPAPDSTDLVIVLQDGTKLWLAEELVVAQLQEGVAVNLSYDERDGEQIVTSIEAAE